MRRVPHPPPLSLPPNLREQPDSSEHSFVGPPGLYRPNRIPSLPQERPRHCPRRLVTLSPPQPGSVPRPLPQIPPDPWPITAKAATVPGLLHNAARTPTLAPGSTLLLTAAPAPGKIRPDGGTSTSPVILPTTEREHRRVHRHLLIAAIASVPRPES